MGLKPSQICNRSGIESHGPHHFFETKIMFQVIAEGPILSSARKGHDVIPHRGCVHHHTHRHYPVHPPTATAVTTNPITAFVGTSVFSVLNTYQLAVAYSKLHRQLSIGVINFYYKQQYCAVLQSSAVTLLLEPSGRSLVLKESAARNYHDNNEKIDNGECPSPPPPRSCGGCRYRCRGGRYFTKRSGDAVSAFY